MKIEEIREAATDKDRFESIDDYFDFARRFLEFRDKVGFQAELVSRNTPQYLFFQYKQDADFQITRPVNTELFYTLDDFEEAIATFRDVLNGVQDDAEATSEQRSVVNRIIYSSQQSIGMALDSLPAGASNRARKINGDLFERFIGLLINQCGVESRSGVVRIPVTDANGDELFKMNYQHDIMIETAEGELKAIGSVKTSSKDRIDKIFIDKFLYNRLTGVDTPHFAIFLNDVQRAGKEPNYRTSNTFLPGHFKGYTVKLNPLDGVYYCDLLPQMKTDPLLSEHIDSIDKFFVDDLPDFIRSTSASNVELEDEPIIEATD
ncbi:hypothetical protein [Corynebacterium accolens]|uniref:hypothetical protein n=1 Tax=Corynebacterium accolens TaxID=38284 RepID=UPI002543D47A|nr:hypothetical protein [Corynebacterium accolens]MDK4265842.1 hypothetical protein [Corynebacterium accolens]MDK4309951.1 hypothetical protein [Corynebacterium accolens]